MRTSQQILISAQEGPLESLSIVSLLVRFLVDETLVDVRSGKLGDGSA
jgi:hypothetical protein